MFTLTRKLALLALLLVLPLQGLAAVIGPLMCLNGGEHHSMQTAAPDHEPGAGHHGSSPQDSSDKSGGDLAGHLECHHGFSGVPMSFEPAPRSDLPVFQTTLSLLATLHIPELPQRPPRA